MKIVCCRAFGPPDRLERIETQAPEPKNDEALVDVTAA